MSGKQNKKDIPEQLRTMSDSVVNMSDLPKYDGFVVNGPGENPEDRATPSGERGIDWDTADAEQVRRRGVFRRRLMALAERAGATLRRVAHIYWPRVRDDRGRIVSVRQMRGEEES